MPVTRPSHASPGIRFFGLRAFLPCVLSMCSFIWLRISSVLSFSRRNAIETGLALNASMIAALSNPDICTPLTESTSSPTVTPTRSAHVPVCTTLTIIGREDHAGVKPSFPSSSVAVHSNLSIMGPLTDGDCNSKVSCDLKFGSDWEAFNLSLALLETFDRSRAVGLECRISRVVFNFLILARRKSSFDSNAMAGPRSSEPRPASTPAWIDSLNASTSSPAIADLTFAYASYFLSSSSSMALAPSSSFSGIQRSPSCIALLKASLCLGTLNCASCKRYLAFASGDLALCAVSVRDKDVCGESGAEACGDSNALSLASVSESATVVAVGSMDKPCLDGAVASIAGTAFKKTHTLI
mmetsp:Transcript_52568/g.83423  ORF Transcript_52568/g.83423 Transcript_52568/m.83423 type:complete len:354 (+) Transcript_52568:315-1376(+)